MVGQNDTILQLESPADDSNLYDVIIIGGGPAGVAAGVYSARKLLKTLIITESFGGQSIASDDIQNWIGEPHLSGMELAKKLEDHVRCYPEIVTLKLGERVVEVKNVPCQIKTRICDFEIKTDSGNTYKAKTVIIATGSRRKKLEIVGEEKYTGKGVSYCTICDAPLYRGKKVVVVGGGNAGLEAVHDLLQYADEVMIIDSKERVIGDEATLEEVKRNSKFKGIILNAELKEILGVEAVKGLKYVDKISGEEKALEVEGVFVETGSVPNSEVFKNLVQTDEHGQITINFQYARSSHPGIFAAGDVTNDPYKQNSISVGDGVRAALSVYAYLRNKARVSPAEEKR